jgi:energy-converting hydrogenase Eha subunit C
MMNRLEKASSEPMRRRGLGLVFGGMVLALVSRRFDDDATAIAVLVPGIVLMMFAILQLTKAMATSSAQSEAVE